MMLFESEAEYLDKEFREERFEQSEVNGTLFSDCVFHNCSFRETIFRQCRFDDCTFHDCDLSLITVTKSSFRHVTFRNSKVIGVNWAIASWSAFTFQPPINFYDCVINYSTFIGLSLPKISFNGCVAKDVDFSEANLTHADFRNAILTLSQFRNTNLTDANFENATEYALNIAKNTVLNTRFSLPEAYTLLHNLDGIILVE